jgi:hypothetical protein
VSPRADGNAAQSVGAVILHCCRKKCKAPEHDYHEWAEGEAWEKTLAQFDCDAEPCPTLCPTFRITKVTGWCEGGSTQEARDASRAGACAITSGPTTTTG